MKVVISTCYGRFGLSKEATNMLTGELQDIYEGDIPRNHPQLVSIVEQLGNRANGRHAKLKIVYVPDDVDWYISEHGGIEHVAEHHRTWA